MRLDRLMAARMRLVGSGRQQVWSGWQQAARSRGRRAGLGGLIKALRVARGRYWKVRWRRAKANGRACREEGGS
jgi:hypothetical protein